MRSSDLLTVEVRSQDNAIVILVRGEIDLATAAVLGESVDEALEFAVPPSPVVVDMSGVDFIGSAGLALLVGYHTRCRERGTPMYLAAPGPAVRRAVQVTALDGLFTVYDRLDQAMARR
jgi:anti-sigma B factor antagonist